mmetsp:Transcript_14250/g.22197  ORF Transcript_14250/g.22197 Transcript_14250/m.22197 type:complete len:104 (-) Transcript_14250:2980-3291(-)
MGHLQMEIQQRDMQIHQLSESLNAQIKANENMQLFSGYTNSAHVSGAKHTSSQTGVKSQGSYDLNVSEINNTANVLRDKSVEKKHSASQPKEGGPKEMLKIRK